MASRGFLKAAPFKVAALQSLWETLNVKHFHGKLKEIPIRITRARRYYGYYSVTESSEAARICISARLHGNPELLQDTMLHEMVHQYLQETGVQNWESHGPEFLEVANKLGVITDGIE